MRQGITLSFSGLLADVENSDMAGPDVQCACVRGANVGQPSVEGAYVGDACVQGADGDTHIRMSLAAAPCRPLVGGRLDKFQQRGRSVLAPVRARQESSKASPPG